MMRSVSFMEYFVIFVTLLILFLIILPLLYSRSPFSIYYDESITLSDLIRSNNERTSIAQKQLHWVEGPYSDVVSENKLNLVIGIISVRRVYGREELGYLTQVVDRTLELNRGYNSNIFVCNVHPGPGPHREADKLKTFVKTINRFSNHTVHHVVMDPFERERDDYVYCLQKALEFKIQFVILLQDDGLPKDAFFHHMSQLINSNIGSQSFDHLHVHGPRNWDAVKLYYPERWQGFNSNTCRHLVELTSLGLLGGAGIAWVFICIRTKQLLFYRTTQQPLRSHHTNVYLVFMLGVCISLFLALAIGRQHVLLEHLNYVRLYSLIPRYDCCSPGVLYTRYVASKVLANLNRTRCSMYFPVDLALEQFFLNRDMRVYSVIPNILHHIGFISTIKSTNPNHGEFMDII